MNGIADALFYLSGQRFIKLAKSPLSPPLAFPFNITSSGILLLNDDGVEMLGPDIHSISCQGLIQYTALPFSFVGRRAVWG